MSLRPWTEPAHVDVLYESSASGPYVTALIATAERRLTRLVPRLAERIGSGEVDIDDVRDAVAQAVIRYMRNPGGLTQSSISEGAFTRSTSYAAAAAAQAGTGIAFTDDELDALWPAGRLPRGIGVVFQSPSRWMVP